MILHIAVVVKADNFFTPRVEKLKTTAFRAIIFMSFNHLILI